MSEPSRPIPQSAAEGYEQYHALNIALLWSPIRPYLERGDISEIMVNGPSDVRIDVGGKIEATPATFASDEDLMAAVRAVAQYVGKRIDDATSRFDARLPDGSRVHVVLPPASRQGICVSIRRFKAVALTPDDLVASDTLTPETLEFLRLAIAAEQNIVVSGSTSSGKTTLLNVLSALIPVTDRVIVLEDSHELQLRQDHALYFEARPGVPPHLPAVTIRDLFHSTLRMRPDRIIVGECRGAEAMDMIQALTSGHGGSMTTLHARSPADALNRLETMALMADVAMPLYALRSQIVSAVDLVVQVSRLRDGRRRILEIADVVGLDEQGRYDVRPCYALVATGGGAYASGHLAWSGHRPSFAADVRSRGLVSAAALTRPLFEASAAT